MHRTPSNLPRSCPTCWDITNSHGDLMYILDKFSMHALACPITCTKILLGLYSVVPFQQYYQGPFIWITWLRIINPKITSYSHDIFTPHVKNGIGYFIAMILLASTQRHVIRPSSAHQPHILILASTVSSKREYTLRSFNPHSVFLHASRNW
jgi:hypothetical protein